MSNQKLVFTLLGTGSSGGVPRIGNVWGVCDPNNPKNRRRRCSALAELYTEGCQEPTRVLIDTSPDIREQLNDVGIRSLDGVIFSHDHADQTHGLDDLRMIAILQKSRVKVHLDEVTARTLMAKFKYCFKGVSDYPAILEDQPRLHSGIIRSITGAGGQMDILPILQFHGHITSLGFRIGSLAYCNDVKAFPDVSLERLADLDVLIIDVLRKIPHPSHAHLALALEWISILKPKRTILTNMHIDLDYEALCKELPATVEPGYDGMKIEIAYEKISHNIDYAN